MEIFLFLCCILSIGIIVQGLPLPGALNDDNDGENEWQPQKNGKIEANNEENDLLMALMGGRQKRKTETVR
jgi:hypothetical protein